MLADGFGNRIGIPYKYGAGWSIEYIAFYFFASGTTRTLAMLKIVEQQNPSTSEYKA